MYLQEGQNRVSTFYKMKMMNISKIDKSMIPDATPSNWDTLPIQRTK